MNVFTQLCAVAALLAVALGQDIDCDMDVMFLVDFTGSMDSTGRYIDTLDAMSQLVQETIVSPTNAQFGVIRFGDGVSQLHLDVSLAQTRTEAQTLSQIDGLSGLTPNYDGPRASDAIQATRDDMSQNSRGTNTDFAVIFLDGNSDGQTATFAQADAARAEGITIVTVGLSDDVDQGHLDQLSDGNTLWMRSAAEIPVAVQAMKAILCPATTQAPDPLPAAPNATDLNCNADVLFVIDYTSSMTSGESQGRYLTVLDHIEDWVQRSNISADNLQFGVMIFGEQSNEIQVQLPLDRDVTTSLDDVLSVLDALRTGQPPNWDGPSFDLALEEVLRQMNNSRTSIDNQDIAVFVTDSPIGNLPAVGALANQARESGIGIVGIGVGTDIPQEQLLILTGNVANNFLVANEADWPSIQQEVADRICQVGDTPVCQFLDVGLVLDASGSISGTENWDRVIEFSKSFVQNFRVGSEFLNFGVIYFKNEAHLLFNVSEFDIKVDVLNKIDELNDVPSGGDTNIAAALRLLRTDMYSNVDRAAPKVAVLITDGQSKVDRSQTPIEAKAARDSGIELFAVGVGEDIDSNELTNITDDAERFLRIDNFERLLEVLDPLIADVCPNCSSPGDWVVIMDSSGSVGKDSFAHEKYFLERLIETMPIDTGDARLGLMKFGDVGDIQWHMNDYSNTAELLLALTRVTYTGGKTNTGDALRRVRTEMFVEAEGDRLEERNVIILFTDGGSNLGPPVMEEARLARLDGITILVVAVTDWVNWREVYEIASDPDDLNTFSVESFDSMFEEAFAGVRAAACNDDNNCLPNPCRNGGACQDEINTYYCLCLPGFAGENCQYVCPGASDVAFIIDASGSIRRDDYYSIQNCYKQLARGLNINTNHHVGLINFNDAVFERFGLMAYNTSKQVVDATSYLYLGGSTNTGEAFRMAREDTFGDVTPDDVRKVAAYASDGHSSDRVSAFQQAARTHEANVTVLGVGVDIKGKYSDMELDGIASDPDAENRWMHDDSCLYVEEMIQAICNAEDNCSPDPCENGGVCMDHIGSYECICGPEWTGVNCTLDCDGVLDIGFLVDVSGSVRESRFRDNIIPFMMAIVDLLEVRQDKTRVGLVTFDWDDNTGTDRTTLQFSIGEYSRKEDIKHAMRRLPYGGGRTNIADGLRVARDDLFGSSSRRSGVPAVLFVVTDGKANEKVDETLPQAVLTREQGIHIIVGSIENDASSLELEGIASRPHSRNIVNVDKYGDLPGVVSTLVDAACDGTNQCPDINACSGFGSCTDLIHGSWCDCVTSRSGPNCELSCPLNSGDIAFVVDASGSVEMFDLAQDLVYAISERLSFNPPGMRAGVMLYQDTARVEIPLDRHTLLRSFLNNLGFTRDMSIHGTNTAAALRMLRSDFFTVGNGDRLGQNNVVVFMTDGHSNLESGNTFNEADLTRAHGEGVRILAVGIGNDVDTAEIRGLAQRDVDAYYLANEADLNVVAIQMADKLCTL